MPDNDIYLRDIAGNPVKATPEQALAMQASGRQVIGQQEAQDAAEAQRNLSYVDQNYGALGKFGLGVASGLTAGLGPDIAASIGLLDPGHLRAAQTSGWYTGGDVAGMMLPALVGDEAGIVGKGLSYTPAGLIGKAGGLAESVVGGFLPEAPGLLGQLASKPIQMAARGSAEGALIGLGHQAGENILDNKPLAAEAMAAMSGGALYGGLLGGGIGLAGGLGDIAINAAKGLAERSGGLEGVVSRRLGLTTEDVKGLSSSEGGLRAGLKSYGEVLEEGGAKLSDSTAKMEAAAKNSKELYTKARNEVLEKLDSEPVAGAPTERIVGRFRQEILTPNLGTPEYTGISSDVANVTDLLTGKGWFGLKATHIPWKKLAQIRDQLSERATATDSQMVNIIDSEMRTAMASEAIQDGAELADKYGAATTKLAIAKRLEETLGAKGAKSILSNESNVTERGFGTAGVSALLGHPYIAAASLLRGAARRMMPKILEPGVAQYAYDSMVGNRALAATSEVKARISKSLDNLFKAGGKGFTEAAVNAKSRPASDRKTYETQAAQAENYLTDNHMQRVAAYANKVSASGYQELAKAIMDNNQRAVQFLQYNRVPGKGAKGLTSLRGYATPIGLDEAESKSARHMFGVNNPLAVIDRIGEGQVSRDEIDALRYVNPAMHTELVTQATQKVYEAKLSGNPLPNDKIVALGVALDAPIDSSLESGFINPVQQALAMGTTPDQQPGPNGPQSPPPAQQMGMSQASQQLMTPMQANSFQYG